MSSFLFVFSIQPRLKRILRVFTFPDVITSILPPCYPLKIFAFMMMFFNSGIYEYITSQFMIFYSNYCARCLPLRHNSLRIVFQFIFFDKLFTLQKKVAIFSNNKNSLRVERRKAKNFVLFEDENKT